MENQVMNLFKQFKLGNSLFRGQWKITQSIAQSNIPFDELKKIAVREMVEQLSDKILNNNRSAIKEDTKSDLIEFNCELLVLKMEDLKTIVESAIQMLSDEKIQEIKLGKSI